MNKEQIWEVLETCLLASDGMNLEDLKRKGFDPRLAKMGVQFFDYLKQKEVEANVK